MGVARQLDLAGGEHPVTRDDEELGTVRWCDRCRDWWPDDAEFFASPSMPCLACVAELVDAYRRARDRESRIALSEEERKQRRLESSREAARRYRARARETA